MAQGEGLRALGKRPVGRTILVALAIVTLAFSMVFLGELIGIGAFLLFGLALPIYAGIKRPRTLAVLGFVTLLLAAPLASLIVTQQTFQPSPVVSSFALNGGSVFQNATVNPFSAGSGSTFDFHMDVFPHYLKNDTTLRNVTLFVTTCPYVSAPNTSNPSCGSGYTSFSQVRTLNLTPTDTPSTLTISQKLPGPNIYWWVAYGTYTVDGNCSVNCTNYTFLDAGNGYADIAGPVSGDFFSVLGIVILPVYVEFLYPALTFYPALLIYMWFKAREARRQASAEVMGRTYPTGGTLPDSAAGVGTAAAAAPVELHCPNCQAVVYPNEATCWKCGKPLTGGGGSSPPLSSGGPPPAQN